MPASREDRRKARGNISNINDEEVENLFTSVVSNNSNEIERHKVPHTVSLSNLTRDDAENNHSNGNRLNLQVLKIKPRKKKYTLRNTYKALLAAFKIKLIAMDFDETHQKFTLIYDGSNTLKKMMRILWNNKLISGTLYVQFVNGESIKRRITPLKSAAEILYSLYFGYQFFFETDRAGLASLCIGESLSVYSSIANFSINKFVHQHTIKELRKRQLSPVLLEKLKTVAANIDKRYWYHDRKTVGLILSIAVLVIGVIFNFTERSLRPEGLFSNMSDIKDTYEAVNFLIALGWRSFSLFTIIFGFFGSNSFSKAFYEDNKALETMEEDADLYLKECDNVAQRKFAQAIEEADRRVSVAQTKQVAAERETEQTKKNAKQAVAQVKQKLEQTEKAANTKVEQANTRVEQAGKKTELQGRELERLRAENEQLKKAPLKRSDIKQKNANKKNSLMDNKNTFKYTGSRISASQKPTGSVNSKKNKKERLAQQATNI